MGPLFKLRLRRIVADEFGRRGFSRRQVSAAVSATDDLAIETAMESCGINVASLPPAIREDRPILDSIAEFFRVIIEWFKSPEGQAFLAALFKILLGLLTGMAVVSTLATPSTLDAVFAASDFKPEGLMLAT